MTALAEAKIRELWPDHISCLASGWAARPRHDQEHGVVCSCGAILGWPADRKAELELASQPLTDEQIDDLGHNEQALINAEVAAGDVPHDVQYAEGFTHPDDYMPSQDPAIPDDPPWDTRREVDGVVPPEDWAAQAAEDAVIAEQARDGNPEGPEDPPDGAVQRWSATQFDTPVVGEDPINAALKAIDATQVYTPDDIEKQLVDIESRLERGQVFHRMWADRALAAAIAYETKYDAKLAEVDGPSDSVRQARARTACREERSAMMLAQHMSKAVGETMHNLRAQLSGYQSIARSVGTTYNTAGAPWDRSINQ
jgi:hypothetical protein